MSENAQQLMDLFVTGIQIGLNPCAQVVLVFLLMALSHFGKNMFLMVAFALLMGFWVLVVNVLLTAGLLDGFVMIPWMSFAVLGVYILCGVFLIVYGLVSLRDWWMFRFKSAGPESFKIGVPVFWKSPEKCLGNDIFRVLVLFSVVAIVLNFIGFAWGHDQALFAYLSGIWTSSGGKAAIQHAVIYYAGYLLPVFAVFILVLLLARLRLIGKVPDMAIGLWKILSMSICVGSGLNLIILAAKELNLFNF